MPIQPASIRFDPRGNAFSEAFDDIYFNPDHAAGKTTHLFHRATRFAEQAAALPDGGSMAVGELGFGLGLNFLGTWAAFKRDAPRNCRLHYVGFDVAPPSHAQLRRALEGFDPWRGEIDALLAAWPGRVAGVHRVSLERCDLTLHHGDVAEMLPAADLGRGGQLPGVWFLDGFAPEKNPAMWSPDVWKPLARLTRPGGRLGSYTAAGHVRRGLAEAGFAVERLPGDPYKRHIVAAQKPAPATPGMAAGERGPRTVAVVGAGWAGLSVAEELHRRGYAVAVLDAALPGVLPGAGAGAGAGASGNAQAVCAPVLDAAASARQDFYRSGFVRASHRHGGCGVRRRPDTQKDAAALRQAAEVFGSLDEHFVWCGDPDDGAGLWMPTAGVARFAAFAQDVVGKLPPDTVRFGFEVTALHREEDAWQLSAADGRTVEADAVVLACADAVRNFSPTADWPLRRIRGQVSRVRATPESNKLQHAIVGEAYLCPADPDGFHSVGATFDPDDDDPAVRPADHDDNRRRARLTAPRWADAMDWSDVNGRVGFRCNTPDYLPMIGPVPDLPACRDFFSSGRWANHDATHADLPAVTGLYAVTALGSHGVITAALATPLIADLLDGTPLPCSAPAYAAVHPGRYLLRAAKRRQPIAYPAPG